MNVIGFTRIIDLDPQGATHAEAQFDSVVEGDALARLTLIFDLLPGGGSVNVNTLLRVYDDGTDQTDDYQETTLEPFVLKAGKHGTWWIYIHGDNYGESYFDLKNGLQPS